MNERFNNLLVGFREIELNSPNEQLKKYDLLLKNFSPFLLEIEEEKRINAASYNIFSVLKIEFYEAKVHTPFLANLLDIEESHCQGDLFFNFFIKRFIPLNKQILFSSYDKDYLYCMEERRFKDSQPDIYIKHEHPDSNKRFAIIIENKIFAGDQEMQIKKYYDLLKSDKFTDEQILIFYLKPIHAEPSEYSLPKELKEYLISQNILLCIDYIDDIKNWLIESKEEIRAVRLNNIIEHYLDNLKKFEL